MTRKLAWFPIALLILAAGYCFRMALADVWATQVRYQLGQPRLSDEEWRLTGQILKQSLLLAPDHASNLELAGQFYQLQGYRQSLPQAPVDRSDSRQKALAYFRQAVTLNPAWPYLWDRLALTKVSLQQFDGELNGALDRVAKLGPWEKMLQYNTAIIGLAASDHLDPLGRNALYSAMEQSLKMQEKDTQQTLMEQFKLKKLCFGLDVYSSSLPILNRRCADKPG